MRKTLEEILSEQREIEEQQEVLEKTNLQIQEKEEMETRVTHRLNQEIEESQYHWRTDEMLQQIFQKQRDVLLVLQQRRNNFDQEWSEEVQRRRKLLRQLDEKYQNELIKHSVLEEEKKGENH